MRMLGLAALAPVAAQAAAQVIDQPTSTLAPNQTRISGVTIQSGPIITARGSDTNVGMYFEPKGTGAIRFSSPVGEQATREALVGHAASPVNYIHLTR
jgi:hypothetical protein